MYRLRNDKIAISIIIPTYKPQNYIIECFESIENQCFEKINFEVIAVLNGERDPYYSFLEKYLLQCNFNYKLFYSDVKGVSNARNIGIEESVGKYLAFVDDDDIISSDYLQGLYDIARKDKIPLSYMKGFVGEITNTKNYYIANVYKKMMNKKLTILNVRSYFASPCYKLIARELVGTHRFDLRFQNGEDSLFMFAISKKKMEFQFADKSAIYYRRIRDNSLTNRKMSLIYMIGNCCRLIFVTIGTYNKSPERYDFIFFVSRILAYIKSVLHKYFV